MQQDAAREGEDDAPATASAPRASERAAWTLPDVAWLAVAGAVFTALASLLIVVVRLRLFGTLDNTVVIETSDHGERVDMHGMRGHGGSPYPPVTKVPLIVRAPRRAHAGVRVARLRDVLRRAMADTVHTPSAASASQ